MKKLFLIKIRDNHHLFKKNQKVWGFWGTGALAHKVVGKYKGGGRWIQAWVHFPNKEEYGKDTKKGFSSLADADFIDNVDVSNKFYYFIKGLSS